MLDLDALSSQDLALVCRKAGEECESRLRKIAERSDPSDRALRDLLTGLAVEARSQVQSLEPAGDRRPSGWLSVESIREFIRSGMKSLSRSFGEGRLHRDAALFYAESLEEELARFYRMLAEHAREAETRNVCFELSEREKGKLRFLRDVVLQG